VIFSCVKRIRGYAVGRVQGVGYRYFVTGCANATGVQGIVRNLPDGSVEIIAEGEELVLKDFLDRCRAKRDSVIRVDRLLVTWEEPTGEFRSFSLRW
jgi:acylphosphatase